MSSSLSGSLEPVRGVSFTFHGTSSLNKTEDRCAILMLRSSPLFPGGVLHVEYEAETRGVLTSSVEGVEGKGSWSVLTSRCTPVTRRCKISLRSIGESRDGASISESDTELLASDDVLADSFKLVSLAP